MIFIDWLSVSQEHPNLPDDASEYALRIDAKTGDVTRRVAIGRQIPGSHDSSVRLRVQNGKVEMSGNPSKWNREDSIHGLTSIHDAVDVFNAILEQEGLPPFVFDDRTYPVNLPGRTSPVFEGAAISRVDLCENYLCGKDAPRVIQWLASHCYRGNTGQVIGDSETVHWGRNRRRFAKYYRKGPELKANAEQTDYMQELVAWSTEQGVIRHEVSLGSNTLRESGLHKPGKWTYEEMQTQMDKVKVHKNVDMATGNWHRVGDDLEALGYKRLVANNAHAIAQAWLNGSLDRGRYNKRTWNRYRKALLAVGIDINQPMNVQRIPLRPVVLNMVPMSLDDLPERFRRKA